jgi:hemerythrin-like domain-containing protein
MTRASEDLKHEHEAVLLALQILEKISASIRSGQKVDRQDLQQILEFFKIFTDTCHHGKEERFLFPALEEAGIPKTNGPIGVMLAEHELGREYMRRMNAVLAEKSTADSDFMESADDYIKLLRAHITKENNILFPMGDLKLSTARQQELLEKFERFENEVIGKGKHEELHVLLKKLKNKYNPN